MLVLYLRVHYIQVISSHRISILVLLHHLTRQDPIVRRTNKFPHYVDRLRMLPSPGNIYCIRLSKTLPLYFLEVSFVEIGSVSAVQSTNKINPRRTATSLKYFHHTT